MVLHKSTFENTPYKILKTIATILNVREKEWTDDQKRLHKLKVEEKLEKAKNQSQYTNKLLNQCKSWRGPVCSIDELNTILSEKPDMMEQIVRTELTYYRNTHKAEVIASPSLFKLNKISHEERLTNLCVLLGGMSDRSITILPGNKDALAALKNGDGVVGVVEEEAILVVNQICVTVWNEVNGKQWYIGYCTEVKENGTFLVEHVDRVKKNSNLKWKYPVSPDTCVVDAEQVMQCEIVGDWNCANDRNMTFTLMNHEVIHKKFMDVMDNFN